MLDAENTVSKEPDGTSAKSQGFGLGITAVVAAVVCCATPLLIGAGIVTSAGVLLRNAAFVGIGLAMVGWPLWRAIHRTRAMRVGVGDLARLGHIEPPDSIHP